MKTVFSLLAILLFCTAYGQACLPTGITFSTQTAINNFQTDYPGCTQIQDNVTIDETTAGTITNLNGLSVVTSIGGNLRILNHTALSDISGLGQLASVGGHFYLNNNDALADLTGLGHLNSITGYLDIDNNDTLASLDGLDNMSISITKYTSSGCLTPMAGPKRSKAATRASKATAAREAPR